MDLQPPRLDDTAGRAERHAPAPNSVAALVDQFSGVLGRAALVAPPVALDGHGSGRYIFGGLCGGGGLVHGSAHPQPTEDVPEEDAEEEPEGGGVDHWVSVSPVSGLYQTPVLACLADGGVAWAPLWPARLLHCRP